VHPVCGIECKLRSCLAGPAAVAGAASGAGAAAAPLVGQALLDAVQGLDGIASDDSASKENWFKRQSFERRISALEPTLSATQRLFFSDVCFPKALDKDEIVKCVVHCPPLSNPF